MSLKMTHLGFLILSFSLLSNYLWASGSDPKSQVIRKIKFEDLAQIVTEKNENIEASRLHMEAQNERTGRIGRSFLPQLLATVGQEQYKKDSLPDSKSAAYWKVEANVNLFKGGRDYLEGRIRNTSHELSRVDYQIELKNELKEAKQTYWKIVSINQLLADTEQALQKNEQNYKAAKRRVGAGMATAADSVQFELYKISLTRRLTKLELEKDVGLNQLSVALALDEHENIEVATEYPKIESATNNKVSNSTSYLIVKKQNSLEQIEKLKSDQVSRWWWPKLDAYASYYLPSLSEEFTDATAKDKQWMVGVKLTIDLGQGFEDLVETQARRNEAKAFHNRAAHSVREGKAHDHELQHDLHVLGDLIKSADSDTALALKFLKLTENEYNRGAKNGPDLLSATQTYFEFRQKRNEYYRDYLSTEAELDSLTASE